MSVLSPKCPHCEASGDRWMGHEISEVYDGVLYWSGYCITDWHWRCRSEVCTCRCHAEKARLAKLASTPVDFTVNADV